MPRPRPSSPRCSSRWKPEARHSPGRYPAAGRGRGAGRSQRAAQRRTGLPAGAHLHHPDPAAAQRAGQIAGPLDGDGRQPGRGGQAAKPGPVRRAEHPLERPVVLRLLQQREDAAAVVVGHDEDQVGPRLPGTDEQAGGVVQEREVAYQGGGGTAPRALVGQRGTGRRGDHAVDPAGAPAGQHPEPGPRRHLLIQVTDGQAGRGPQQGAVRQGRRQVPREPRLGQALAVVEDGRRRGRGRRIGRAPGGQPRGARGAGPPPHRGRPASRTAGTTSVALRAGSAQCPGPCATTTCRTGAAVLR